VNILFVMRTTVYVRNFEWALRLLAERGHHVHVAAEVHPVLDPTNLMGRLCREYPQITHSVPPPTRATRWSKLGFDLRRAVDYLRYLRPEFENAPKLRRRAEHKAPAFVRWALKLPAANTPGGRQLLARALGACDRLLPRDPQIDAFVRACRPNLVLVTPLVEPGSPQSEFVRSAQALGIPAGLCVHSWDNLTTKGLIHDQLDLVTVWNDTMKDEAVTLHGVSAERVVVTGAVAYDHWFDWKPSTTRESFCARVGLDPARPYLVYLCSSRFIAPDEVPFVRWWIQAVRRLSRTLNRVGVLVRPHPQNTERWRTAEIEDMENVAIWPRGGDNPTDAASRAAYYDSIYHAAAVAGVNTSALIESAIIGRSVYTLLAPEFRDTQQGTLHFRHLQHVNGGVLSATSDLEEHVRQLEAAVLDPTGAAQRCRRFVEAFVRPYGWTQAASPLLVEALEAAGGRAREPRRLPKWASALRPALGVLATAVEAAERRAVVSKSKRWRTSAADAGR
jgi:hypothetical protein